MENSNERATRRLEELEQQLESLKKVNRVLLDENKKLHHYKIVADMFYDVTEDRWRCPTCGQSLTYEATVEASDE